MTSRDEREALSRIKGVVEGGLADPSEYGNEYQHGFRKALELVRVAMKSEQSAPAPLPTTPGCVFRARVRGVENVRVFVTTGGEYVLDRMAGDQNWSDPEHIDPATVRIELEGEVEA